VSIHKRTKRASRQVDAGEAAYSTGIKRAVHEFSVAVQACESAGLRIGDTLVPVAPLHDVSGLTPMRNESVAAMRTRRVPNISVAAGLALLINRQSFHGSWLQQLTGNDNVDPILARVEALGWVKRGDFDPKAQHINGEVRLAWGHQDKIPESNRLLRDYHWITVTTKWLEAADVEAAL
jgi:hypothetical protein